MPSSIRSGDARGCRALAGRRIKTDREDAFNVAELLMTGRLPTAWAPPNNIQRLLDLARKHTGPESAAAHHDTNVLATADGMLMKVDLGTDEAAEPPDRLEA